MACPWVTQALDTPAHVRNYQDFVATYLEDHVDQTDHSAFWEALYGLYEADANDDGAHRLYDAPLFAPRNFSTDKTDLHFMRPVPFAHEASGIPTTAAGDAQYSTAVQDGVFGPAGVRQAIGLPSRGLWLTRSAMTAQGGDHTNPVASFNGALGITHAAFWCAGLLLENINFLSGLNKKSYQNVDTWLAGSSLLSRNLVPIGRIHGGLTHTAATQILGAAGNLGVFVFDSIIDARAIYKTTRKKADMAQCLTRLEDFFAAGQEAAQTGQLRQALKDDHYQWSAEIASLYVMVSWLSRKYQRCLTGKKFASLPHNLIQIGLNLAAVLAAIAASTATYGLLVAISVGLGLFYWGTTSRVAYKRYKNNCTAFQDYQRLIQQLRTEERISVEEYEQEQWLFALASRLRPYRHKIKGATIGDYFRCKIASFVIIGKQKLQELRTDAALNERAQLMLLCVDILGDAIGYNKGRHGQYISQGDLGTKTLRLANSIPIRGY